MYKEFQVSLNNFYATRKYLIAAIILLFSSLYCNAQIITNPKNQIADSFSIKIDVCISDTDHVIRINCTRSNSDTIAILSSDDADTYFPEDFYSTLISDILILTNFPSYASLYNYCKSQNFNLNMVSYERFLAIGYSPTPILVNDINNDGSLEIIISNKEQSGNKNPLYDLYRLDKTTNTFIKVDNFFKGAFYGWDETYRYLVTGWANGIRFTERKNLIKQWHLRPIQETIYLGEKVISRKKYNQ